MGANLARSALILNQTAVHCSSAQCDSVAELLHDSYAFSDIQEKHDSQLTDSIPVAPDLVLLRTSLGQIQKDLVRSCRERWRHAFLVAVVCPERNPKAEDLSPLITGVDDFLSCPFEKAELWLRIQRLFQSKRRVKDGLLPGPAERLRFQSIVGESAVFVEAINKVGPLARVKAPVLISGETGTGKELFARAIHYQGPRQGKPFIPVNCGALPDHLFENELFGHIKGAFTDASSTQTGLIAEAEGGTLFLDEIDALSPSGQVKLLRFLQNGEYRPLGSSRTITADVRVVAATNADLMQLMKSNAFREDLYYRLNSLRVFIPALRDRREDILALCNYFLNRYAAEHSERPRGLSNAALHKLIGHSWPGNVRELEGVLFRALVLSASQTLQPEDIDVPSAICAESESKSLREAKITTVSSFERSYLIDLLTSHQGNVTHAAKVAGKERRAFQRLLRKYSLDRQRFHS